MSGTNIQICHYHKSVSQFKMTNIVMRSNEFNYILYRKGPLAIIGKQNKRRKEMSLKIKL
jgi:hypothetical protein